MNAKTDEELFNEHAEMNRLATSLYNQADEKRKMALEFFKNNYDAIFRHETKILGEKRKKEKKKVIDKKEQDLKVFQYLEPGMWVMVKTRTGLKWKQITHKEPAKNNYYSSYVYCAEPNNPNRISHDKHDDTYSAIDLGVNNVYRNDAYVVNSIRHVLVPTGNGRYVKKSLRGEIVKDNT